MEPLSKIANLALDEITNGQFFKLPKLAINGLLNDFQHSWLRRFKISYKFEMLDIARGMCNGENKVVFRVTQLKSIEDIRDTFSSYIRKWHESDDRVILSLHFDGEKVNAEWIELKEYLKYNKANKADVKKPGGLP